MDLVFMLYDKTILLLMLSLILVGLLSNKLSNPFFEFQGKGNINHNTALALKPSGQSQNNTEIQSTTSPIYKTNNSSSNVSALVDKGRALYNLGNYTQAIQSFNKALAIDPNYKEALSGKGNALDGIGSTFYNQGEYTQSIQYYNKALAINSTDSSALFGKQNAISKIVESASTSGYNRGCIDAQIPNPSERYINQLKNGPTFHRDAVMQAYKEGFDACSGNLPTRVETLKMFNVIVLKGNVTDETANTRICTTVSGEYSPQTICQNLDNLKPENNGSNSIESNIFTFEGVPVNAPVYYEGLDWWGICNNSLLRSYISQPCETLVSPDHRALTSQGKIVLEGILCPKGPSILSTIELFYGPIPDKAKNELGIACGWQMAR